MKENMVTAQITREMHRILRIEAAQTSRTLTEVIMEILDRWLKEKAQSHA